MDVPSDTLGRIFDRHFVYGSVWFYKDFYFPSTGETHDKYLIVLNPNAVDNLAYFILPTSRVEKVRKNAILARDAFFIAKGGSDIFPVDTVVVVGNIHSLLFRDIRNSYISSPFFKRIEYKGILDSIIMDQIRDLALSSRRISPKVLKIVFPTN